MKYRLLAFVMLLFSFAGGSFAAVVSEKTAVDTATKLLTVRGGSSFKGGNATVETVSQEGFPMYYIVRFEKGGWALISAEDTVDPLLGYSFDSEYVSDGQPAWVQSWLKDYTDQIKLARKSPALQRHFRWAGDVVTRATEDRIEPLVQVTWNQGVPYNAYCPAATGGPGGRAYVGCVAVAMGQALSVIRYPLRGTGTKSYYSNQAGTECYLRIETARDRTAAKPYQQLPEKNRNTATRVGTKTFLLVPIQSTYNLQNDLCFYRF